NDKRLKQYQSHLLGQPALMQLQFRPDNDYRTAGIIDAFAQQVLAETSAFALEHVAEGFESAVAGAGHRAAMAAIVEQRIDRFLQHALFVADDDFRRLELEQVFEAIVPVDHAAIKVVEIGSRETATFQRHERAQVRRDDGQDRQYHPFRAALRGLQSLQQLD